MCSTSGNDAAVCSDPAASATAAPAIGHFSALRCGQLGVSRGAGGGSSTRTIIVAPAASRNDSASIATTGHAPYAVNSAAPASGATSFMPSCSDTRRPFHRASWSGDSSATISAGSAALTSTAFAPYSSRTAKIAVRASVKNRTARIGTIARLVQISSGLRRYESASLPSHGDSTPGA